MNYLAILKGSPFLFIKKIHFFLACYFKATNFVVRKNAKTNLNCCKKHITYFIN